MVTAPALFGRLHLAPLATEFVTRFPQVRIELLLLDRVVNLLEEGIDLAVRIAHLPDSSLVAVTLGQIRRVVCATPALLRRTGTPREPQELARRPVVRFSTTLGARDKLNSGKRAVDGWSPSRVRSRAIRPMRRSTPVCKDWGSAAFYRIKCRAWLRPASSSSCSKSSSPSHCR